MEKKKRDYDRHIEITEMFIKKTKWWQFTKRSSYRYLIKIYKLLKREGK